MKTCEYEHGSFEHYSEFQGRFEIAYSAQKAAADAGDIEAEKAAISRVARLCAEFRAAFPDHK